jgi:hypothetical protein
VNVCTYRAERVIMLLDTVGLWVEKQAAGFDKCASGSLLRVL